MERIEVRISNCKADRGALDEVWSCKLAANNRKS